MGADKLMLVDGNSILNRAFYGIRGPNLLATSDGLYTNAVYGFINILNKYLEEEKPQYICVAFDLRAPTFRHKEFDGYKAKRKGMPDELAVQVPVIKEVLDAMNIKRAECEGFEADDIIGSLSFYAEESGLDVIIITGDRDSLQLASKTTRIKIPVTRAGKTETEEFDHDKVIERYGVTPGQFVDVKALMGDQSDNIPGVPGIGEKTALDLIIKFRNIENLYDNIDLVDKKSVAEKLITNKDLAFMSKKIAAIDRQMPEMCNIGDLRLKEYDNCRLYKLFTRLEFKSFIEKFGLSSLAAKTVFTKNIDCIKQPDELQNLKNTLKSCREFSIFCLLDKPGGFVYRLAGAGISWAGDKSAYIDLSWQISEETFLKEFKSIFEDESIRKYGHDIKNLTVYLKKKGIRLQGLAFDTMIAAYIIQPSRDSYPLSQLADEYLKIKIQPVEELTGKGRNFRPFGDMALEDLAQVAGIHSEVIFNLRGVLHELLLANNQEELYYNIELPLVEVLADMEYIGFKVDINGLKEFSHMLQSRINLITSEIYKLAGEEFNINSTKQLGVILFDKLKLPVFKKTKTGYSTDAEVLERLAPESGFVLKILEYRQLVKLKSTYVEGLLAVINPQTGRIHSSFNQTVTVTGRISSTEPNLQNIPIKLDMGREIRKVFIPENPCYILLDADYSQIELRVLAHISNDMNMIGAFKNNEDIHTATAAKVFNVARDEVTPLLRSRAKAVNFGIIYGIGDFSLSRDLNISRKEAKRYIDEYLNEYSGVRQYMKDIIALGHEKGYITTMFNRRRYLPELMSNNFSVRSFGERVALNTPIQGSAADIIKIAMVKVYRELLQRGMKSRLILQVHDELIVETFIDEKDQVAEILKDSMENAAHLSVQLCAEVKTGANWYEAK